MDVYYFEMENEEEEIDFEELSKEYPLFFSSFEDLPKEKYYPSPKIPQPISDDPPNLLEFDDYMLDERISNLQFYDVDDSNNNSSNKIHSSKQLSSPPSLHSSKTNTETNMTHSSLKNYTNKSSSTMKKKYGHDTISRLNDVSIHKSKMSLINLDDLDFKETCVQPPKNIIKKNLAAPPPPPPQLQLHSGYPLMFDFIPQNPQRHQKLKNGTEKTFYQNGDILVHFSSGKEKIYRQNLVITKFKNGDVLQEFLDGTTAYRYGNTGTVELTLPDHTSIIQYPNGQRERRNPEGDTIVKFSDGVFMKVDVDGNWTMVQSKT